MPNSDRSLSKLPKPVVSKFKSKRRSVIAYPGGKTRGVSSIVPVLLEGLRVANGNQLLSPFLGGGSVELACAAEGVNVTAYDIDANVICCYDHLLNDPISLANTVQQYLTAAVNDNPPAFKELQKLVPQLPHCLPKAAGYYVANRMSYAGLTFSGGMASVNRLKPSNIAALRSFVAPNLTVGLLDYREALLKHPAMFAYLDPPYDFLEGRKNRYYGINGDGHRGFDHDALFAAICERPDWVMSYNADPHVLKRYAGFPMAIPEWTYCMSKKGPSNEVLIFAKNLTGLAASAAIRFKEMKAANDNAKAIKAVKAAAKAEAANDNPPPPAAIIPPVMEMMTDWSAPDLSVISETMTPAPRFPRSVLGEAWEEWCSEVATGANAHFDYVWKGVQQGL